MAFGMNSNEKSNEKYNNQLLQDYNKNFTDIRNSYTNRVKQALLDGNSEKVSETMKEAQELGFSMNLSNIIKGQMQGTDASKRILSNMPLRERLQAKRDLNI